LSETLTKAKDTSPLRKKIEKARAQEGGTALFKVNTDGTLAEKGNGGGKRKGSRGERVWGGEARRAVGWWKSH